MLKMRNLKIGKSSKMLVRVPIPLYSFLDKEVRGPNETMGELTSRLLLPRLEDEYYSVPSTDPLGIVDITGKYLRADSYVVACNLGTEKNVFYLKSHATIMSRPYTVEVYLRIIENLGKDLVDQCVRGMAEKEKERIAAIRKHIYGHHHHVQTNRSQTAS